MKKVLLHLLCFGGNSKWATFVSCVPKTTFNGQPNFSGCPCSANGLVCPSFLSRPEVSRGQTEFPTVITFTFLPSRGLHNDGGDVRCSTTCHADTSISALLMIFVILANPKYKQNNYNYNNNNNNFILATIIHIMIFIILKDDKNNFIVTIKNLLSWQMTATTSALSLYLTLFYKIIISLLSLFVIVLYVDNYFHRYILLHCYL